MISFRKEVKHQRAEKNVSRFRKMRFLNTLHKAAKQNFNDLLQKVLSAVVLNVTISKLLLEKGRIYRNLFKTQDGEALTKLTFIRVHVQLKKIEKQIVGVRAARLEDAESDEKNDDVVYVSNYLYSSTTFKTPVTIKKSR